MNENGSLEFQLQSMGRRSVVARFDAEHVSSDGGLPLLREVAQRSGLLQRFSTCFRDYRDPRMIEHSVVDLISQRIFAITAGYEDLNDHATLCKDPLLAMVSGKLDVRGDLRSRKKDRGKPLASPSTLNRLELTPADADERSRYKKIVYDAAAIEAFFIEAFFQLHSEAPAQIVLDLDATDDPIHGHQEGRFFHGYYGNDCYLPLYIFCGDHLLAAKLRPSNIDGSSGALEEVQRIVKKIRSKWPTVKIILRADSGFTRDAIMSWCEANVVDFVFGLAKNARLEEMIREDLIEAERRCRASGQPERIFGELVYRTRDSWSRERRVVAKAEHIVGKANPRFVVSSLPPSAMPARELYEDFYCARGDMENRIKEQQLALFADRTSAQTMRANQLRLWFASVAYVLMNALRIFGLAGTALARAQCDTIRTRLIKVGALVCVSVRRVLLRLSAAAPVRELFGQILTNLRERLAVL